MRRLLRIVVRLVLVAGLAVVVAVAGLLYWAQQDSARIWLAETVSALLSEVLAGEIRVERIGGSLWRDLELTGVTVHYGDKQVLAAPRLLARFRLDPTELLRLRIRIDHIEIHDPVADMTLDSNGVLDLVEAFLPIVDDAVESEPQAAGVALVILLDHVALTGGRVRFAGVLEDPIELHDLDVGAAVGLWGDGVDVRLDSIRADLRVPGVPDTALQAQVRFDDRTPPATISIGPVELTTGASKINLSALLRDARGDFSNLHIDARADIERLDRATLAALVDGWPIAAPISGEVNVHGDLDVLRVDGGLDIGTDKLAIAGRLDLAGAKPKFDATVRTTDFALANVARDLGIGGALTATVQAAGAFDDPLALEIGAELAVRDLSRNGRPLGQARAEARMRQQALVLNAELAGAVGTIGVYGRGHLAGTQSFAADVFLANADISALEVSAPKSAVNLVTRVAGSIPDDDRVDLQAVTYVARSVLADIDIDAGVVRTHLLGDRIEIAELKFGSGPALLGVEGFIDLAEDAPSALRASLQVPRLEFAATRTRIGGGGRLDAEAALSGPIRTPHVRATATLGALQTDGVELQSATLELDADIDAAGRADGALALAISGLDSPLKLDTVTAQLDLLAQGSAQGFRLAVEADDPIHGRHRIGLDGSIATAETRLTLDDLRIGSSLGEWRLEAPATFSKTPRSAALTPLRIASELGVVSAEATIPERGAIDVAVNVSGINLAFLTAGLRRNARIDGTFAAALTGSGSAAEPELDFRAAIEDIQVGGKSRGRFAAVGALRNSEATIDARFDQDDAHWLRATASLPVEVPANAPQEARVAGPLRAKVHSPGLLLDVLRPFAGTELRNLDGKLAVDVTIAGPVASPDIIGSIAITEGTARLQPLRVTVRDFVLRASHAPGTLRIEELTARAEQGRLAGGGAVTLAGYVPESFDLRIEASRWPAIRTDRYQAEIGTDLGLTGTAAAPQIAGRVTVENAFLRPDLRFLESSAGPPERDATILVIDSSMPSFAPDAAVAVADAGVGFPELVAIDVRLEIQRGTRVRHEMADIELSGNLRLRQNPGGKPEVTGQVETVRGWVQIQGREFQLERGAVTFAGGAIENPSLDIVARHRRSPYVVRAAIGGTVEEPTLNLSSEPALDQADILAVLLFGRPLAQLDEGEKSTLQQQALSVTTGYAAGVLGQAVTEALGLESLGIDLRDVDFTGGRIGIGRYITPNTYVSVTQDLTEQRGRTVSVEYFLTPQWKILTSTDSLGASGADIIWQTLY